MLSQHNLRIITKLLVAAISVAGICSAYLYITDTSTDAKKDPQALVVQEIPVASVSHVPEVSHLPEERLALEALAGGKANHNVVDKIERREGEKIAPVRAIDVKKPKTSQAKIGDLPGKKTSNGIKARAIKLVAAKKAPERDALKTPMKDDPIAALLAKH